jgi:hypothetical protein
MKTLSIVVLITTVFCLLRIFIHWYIIEKKKKYINHTLWFWITALVVGGFTFVFNLVDNPWWKELPLLSLIISQAAICVVSGAAFWVTFDPGLNLMRGLPFSYTTVDTTSPSKLDIIFNSQGFWFGYFFKWFLLVFSSLVYLNMMHGISLGL